MSGLTKKNVLFVVKRYIGVNAGYLGDFSYRTHREFYSEFCDLEIDPDKYEGTTRQRFIQILSSSDPLTQAQILEGVLDKYPPNSSESRTAEKADRIRKLIRECQASPLVSSPNISAVGEVVARALTDAELLLRQSGPTNALDRAHTALHGYLKVVCRSIGMEPAQNESATALFKWLRAEHPALRELGPQAGSATKVLRSLANVIDALSPARNHGSLAHPNDDLADDDAAMLFINAARTILQYLRGRISRYEGASHGPSSTTGVVAEARGNREEES